MLTRIEVDGFKNLLGFSAEFGPFTCIAGPNAVGKSNLFDAIEFLSLLVEYPFEEAAQRVRKTSGSLDGARRLFWTNGSESAESIKIAAEMIVPSEVVDPLGQWTAPDAVCFRYELTLRHEKGLRLVDERLLARAADNFLRFPHGSFFSSYLQFSEPVPGAVARVGVIFDVAANQLPGGTSGTFEPAKAGKTVLSEYANADYPDLLAVKSEMTDWRRFSLDPEVLRMPVNMSSRQTLGSRGEYLPAQLRQLMEPRDSEPWRYVYDKEELSAQLCARMGTVVRMRSIWVQDDPNTGLMTVRAILGNGDEVSARDLSDGTLRYLALAALALTTAPALYCIEEPENGLHPRAIADLFELLEDLSIDEQWVMSPPHANEGEDSDVIEIPPPFRQVIINTHSPVLVDEIYKRAPEDLLMASSVLVKRGNGHGRALRLHPIGGTWRCTDAIRGVNLPVVDYVGTAVRPWPLAGVAEDK